LDIYNDIYLSKDTARSYFWMEAARLRPEMIEGLAASPLSALNKLINSNCYRSWYPDKKPATALQLILSDIELGEQAAKIVPVGMPFHKPNKDFSWEDLLSRLEDAKDDSFILLSINEAAELMELRDIFDTAFIDWSSKYYGSIDWLDLMAKKTLVLWAFSKTHAASRTLFAPTFNFDPETGKVIEIKLTNDLSMHLSDPFLMTYDSNDVPKMLRFSMSDGWRIHIGEDWKVAKTRMEKQFKASLKEYRKYIEKLVNGVEKTKLLYFEWLVRRAIFPREVPQTIAAYNFEGRKRNIKRTGGQADGGLDRPEIYKQSNKLARFLELKLPKETPGIKPGLKHVRAK